MHYPEKHTRCVLDDTFRTAKTPNIDRIWDVAREFREFIPDDCTHVIVTTLDEDEESPTLTFASARDPFGKKSRLCIAVAFIKIDSYRWIKENCKGIKDPVFDATDSDWESYQAVFRKWFVAGLKKSWVKRGSRFFGKELGISEAALYVANSVFHQSKGELAHLEGPKLHSPRKDGKPNKSTETLSPKKAALPRKKK